MHKVFNILGRFIVVGTILFLTTACTAPTATATSTLTAATNTIQATTAPATSPTVTTAPPTLAPTAAPQGPAIHDIQGAGHHSPYENKMVEGVTGIVTGIRADGFFLQDPKPDQNDATSEGITVVTQGPPAVKRGDAVMVTGKVIEFFPGGVTTGNLSTTEIISPEIEKVSSGNPLAEPVIMGKGGRMPPNQVIEDDVQGSAADNGTFDPENDGLDFYESLESMRVQINNAVVVGPTSAYKEATVLVDNGEGANERTPRGGIILQANDANPERIMLDDMFMIMPNLSVGDRFTQPVVGIMDYNYGSPKLLVTQKMEFEPGGLQPQAPLAEAARDQLTVVTYNLKNFNLMDDPARIEILGKQIAQSLNSPDIIALQEVQDNDGAADSGTVDASENYKALAAAIKAASGAVYQFVDIAPEDNLDGGAMGGNIRVGFLYRTDRGLSFTRRASGDAETAVKVSQGANGVQLSFNPGRIDPTNPAFKSSRKPLVGEFLFNGRKVFIVNNHFNSKGGDAPLYGENQPPVFISEEQRLQQAEVVNAFVKKILDLDPQANVIVLGDLNDFQWSQPLTILEGSQLYNLVDTLPVNEQYTYIFEGNAETLDQILVSQNLFKNASMSFTVMHLNSEFFDTQRISDHDPVVARFILQ